MGETEQYWYVYIVECNDRSLYTGITLDVERRVMEHNQGLGAKYTSGRRPVRLVHLESCLSRSAASSREYEIKRMTASAKRRLLNQ